MNNTIQIPINQAQDTTAFNNLVMLLIRFLKKLRTFSYSYKTIAKMLGVCSKTIQRAYAQLREDPRFFVGYAIRRPYSPFYYTIKVAFSKVFRRLLIENVHGRITYKDYYLNEQSSTVNLRVRNKLKVETTKKYSNEKLFSGPYRVKTDLKYAYVVCGAQNCQRRFIAKREFGTKCLCAMNKLEKKDWNKTRLQRTRKNGELG